MTEDTLPHVELFVRSMLPDGANERQEAVLDRLERLDREDEIADYNVVVWGKQIAPESAAARTPEGKYILNRVAEFKQWALSNNVSLESFYQTTDVESEVTEEAYTAMVLPVMGLAEYREAELSHVAPCTEGDVVHTIMDRLDAIEDGRESEISRDSADVSIV
ncbi:HTH domain-containing protein [Haloarcula halophila]|uniref:HTH domain-containing protein n=1 Tax=Haloarcula TaxID=2237 RepID=UPI0023E38659|nr:HTH domain-containing protein [Halomicroarcula sp. DFY41]